MRGIQIILRSSINIKYLQLIIFELRHASCNTILSIRLGNSAIYWISMKCQQYHYMDIIGLFAKVTIIVQACRYVPMHRLQK